MGSPTRSIDISVFASWLALRAVDQQAKKLDVLEGREASVPAAADPGAPAEEPPRAERPADARVAPPSPPQHPRPTARVQKPRPSVGEPLQLMPYQLWFGVR
jgi:large subunit ribosomal protein L24